MSGLQIVNSSSIHPSIECSYVSVLHVLRVLLRLLFKNVQYGDSFHVFLKSFFASKTLGTDNILAFLSL